MHKSGLLQLGRAGGHGQSAYELSVKSELAAQVDCAFLDRRQLKPTGAGTSAAIHL